MNACHVVNALTDTTMAGDLAVKQVEVGDVDRVDVCCWRGCNKSLEHPDVDIYDLAANNTTRLQRMFEFDEIVSEADIVHVHHTVSGILGKVLATRHRKPIVVTEHNSHAGYETHRLVVDNLTNRLADRVVCVSESVEESLAPWERKMIGGNKLCTVYNGVDVDRIEDAKNIDWSIHDQVDIDPNAVIVSSAGMLIEQKAQHVLIDAVDEANKTSDTPIELVISGDGRRKEELQTQIDESKFSDQMHLLGFLPRREQVYKMMHESHIYAMPSRWEGFCVAALEALAAGNACIFSNIDAFTPFSEVVLLHDQNCIEDLRSKIHLLAENQNKRDRMIVSGKNLVTREYTLESTAKFYARIYQSLLNTQNHNHDY